MVDVLNLEWTSFSSRDRNISSLVCNYLRYQGLNVVEESIFHGFDMIEKLKPRLVFIANGVGSAINFYIVKYAALKGIKVVTLISEGNFKDNLDEVDEFLWGWNKDHIFYEDSHMQWCERTRNLSLAKYPDYKDIIKVSGGCGFDIYKIKPMVSKEVFLKQFNKENYSRVIGVGCWDFSICYPNNLRSVYTIPEEAKARFQKDRDLFNRILINIIKANPSILFILKEHPGNIFGHDMSGIDGAETYQNVLILKNESIIDTIAVSDLWLTYESTTVFEAWMLGKPTCLLNPTGIDFPRANTYLGSPNFPDEKSLQEAIDSFYSSDILPHFDDEDIALDRRKVIKDTIQWDDGLNHVRAGNEIIRVLKSDVNKGKKRIPIKIQYERFKQKLIYFLKLKDSSFYKWSNAFHSDEVKAFSSELLDNQKMFYESLKYSKEDLSNILPI